jgi:hypothetical protein
MLLNSSLAGLPNEADWMHLPLFSEPEPGSLNTIGELAVTSIFPGGLYAGVYPDFPVKTSQG